MRRETKRLMASLVACGSLAGMASAAHAQESLTVQTGTGFWANAIQKCIVDPFSKSTGVRITIVPGTSEVVVPMLQQNKAKPILDVTWLGAGLSEYAYANGLVQPLNPSEIPNMANMLPEGMHKGPDGKIYALSSGYYSFGIVYNTQKITTPPTSWNDLWDPKYANRVVIPSVTGGIGGVSFLVFLAQLSGGSAANIEPAMKRLKTLQVLSYNQSPGEANNDYSSGEAIIGVHDSASAWALADRGLPITFDVPKEGVPSADDRVQLVANTPKRALALRFINAAASQQASQCISETLYTAPVVKGVVLTAKEKSRMPWGPNGSFSNLKLIDWPTVNQNRAKINEIWGRGVSSQ